MSQPLSAVALRLLGAEAGPARTLLLEPGTAIVARVLEAPSTGGRGAISLAGVRLEAQLPHGLEAGQTLPLEVVSSGEGELVLRVRGGEHSAHGAPDPTLAQAAGRLAVAGEGELLRAALALAEGPLWLPNGGGASVEVDADGGGRDGAGEQGQASFVLHCPDLGALEVRLHVTAAGVRVAVTTAPGEAAGLAGAAADELVAGLQRATGRHASVHVQERRRGSVPPAPPEGRVDAYA